MGGRLNSEVTGVTGVMGCHALAMIRSVVTTKHYLRADRRLICGAGINNAGPNDPRLQAGGHRSFRRQGRHRC